ncbi:MAG TPA: tyrosine-type recombinase/integrase [Gemmatimonadaceae bacterium]
MAKTPKLINGRGTLPLKKRFKGVGLIRKMSGTTDSKTYHRIVDTMDQLHNVGNFDALLAVKRGVLSPLELLEHVTKKGLTKVGDLQTNLELDSTLNKWLDKHDIKETTRKTYRGNLSRFLKSAPTGSLVKDIPALYQKYRDTCIADETKYMALAVRRILLSFTATTYGRNSDIYRDIQNVNPPKVEGKLKNDAVTVADIRLLMTCLPEHHARIVWHICLTGMRKSEFFETSEARWTVHTDRVSIQGSKNANSVRSVFKVEEIDKPSVGDLAFRRALTKALKDDRAKSLSHITPHTFRKCFARWMNEAGIFPAHQRWYMGHDAKSMTEFYQKHDVTPFLDADGKLFAAFLAASQT